MVAVPHGNFPPGHLGTVPVVRPSFSAFSSFFRSDPFPAFVSARFGGQKQKVWAVLMENAPDGDMVRSRIHFPPDH
jgi:hypothetical protein